MEALRIIRGVNSPNIGMVYVACHTYHTGADMTEIMRAAGDKLRLVHVADTRNTTAATDCGTSPTLRAIRFGCTSI
jgi:sugar phosphate isomerase/epimerase